LAQGRIARARTLTKAMLLCNQPQHQDRETMPHIVIVEDETDVREFLYRAFRRHAPNCEITAVGDGSAALDVIQLGGCDLIVSDQRMPIMTGIELLRAMRAQAIATPVVIISADMTTELAAIEAGANAFFYKPLSMNQIREIIQTWLAPSTS
jgi:CheY-like chemotaxis protein